MSPESTGGGPSRKFTFRDLIRQIREAFVEAQRFFREELWDVDLRALPRIKMVFVSLVRIVGIVVRGVIHDRCGVLAGTLTYLTLLALVPILALMFSVSKGLGAQDMLMDMIGLVRAENAQEFVVASNSRLAEAPEQFGEIAVVVFSAVERANVRTLGGIGLVVLLWTVIRVVGKVEHAFNDIWSVRTPRTLARRMADNISILVVVPILILLSSSVHAFFSSDRAVDLVRHHLGELSMVYELALRWTVGGAVVLAFVFLLMFMPNTRVRFFPALVGGVVTGLCWLFVQSVYFMAQGGVARYNAIYGTFAALPLFLVWVHASWIIVLVGAEVSFAVQNHRTFRWGQGDARASPATLTELAIWALSEVGARFVEGRSPWCMETFAQTHEIPMRLLAHAVHGLCEHRLLQEVADAPGCYVPGRDLSGITLADAEDAFRGPVDPKIARLIQVHAPELDRVYRERRERCVGLLAQTLFHDLVQSKPAKQGV